MRNAALMPLHLDAFVGHNLTFSHQISVQLKTSEHFRAHFCLLGSVFTKRRHFRPDPFLSCAERWQDSRAVRDSKGPCSEKGPFLARSPRGVFPNGCLRGISDAWRAYLAKASPFSDAWRANLAANWRFSRPRPLSGCMERKTCHGLPPGDAPRRNPATARHSRTHRARILPLPVRPRVHQGAILPPSDAGGTHCASILPSSSARERTVVKSCHRQTSENAQRRHTSTASRPSRSALHVGEWVQSLGCAVGFGAQHFLCEGVGIPPSRGLTAGNDFESALFRWATMSPLRVLQSCAVLCAEAKSALTFI